MTQKKKGLSNDQCALRKLVATEIGMTKHDMRQEITTAIETLLAQKTAHLNIGNMIQSAVNRATGDYKELRGRVDVAIDRAIKAEVKAAILEGLEIPESIDLTLKLNTKVKK